MNTIPQIIELLRIEYFTATKGMLGIIEMVAKAETDRKTEKKEILKEFRANQVKADANTKAFLKRWQPGEKCWRERR
jgi:hypothetical protein